MGAAGEVKALIESKPVLGYIATVATAMVITLGVILLWSPEQLAWFGPAKPFVGVAFLISAILSPSTLLFLGLYHWATKTAKSKRELEQEAAAHREATAHILRKLSLEEKGLLQGVKTGHKMVQAKLTNATAAGLVEKGVLLRPTNFSRGATMEYVVSDLAFELLRDDPTLLQ